MSLTSLDIQGYGGLDTLIRAGFLRPVQIVRQTISHNETQIRRISAYHNYEGLSIGRKIAGDKEGYTYPYWYNKPYRWICGYAAMEVWDILV